MKRFHTIVFFITLSFQSFGQANCRYPFNQSADSLVKFVIADIYRLKSSSKINAKFQSENFKKYNYNPNSDVNHDSIFQVCINDLREKLGDSLLCNNVDLYLGSFYHSNDYSSYWLSVGFTYPILKREKQVRIGTFTSLYERINIKYEYLVNSDGKISMKFPENVPECKGQRNCNIYITREKAIEILTNWGLIKEGDNVRMSVDGLNWEITLTSDGWKFRHLKINIKTGALSDFKESHRID